MTTSTVSTVDAVWAALTKAAPGDAITVAPGKYDTLNLGSFKFADPGVTISGAGVTLQQVTGSGCEGIALSSFEVLQAAVGWMSAVNISSAKRILIDQFVVHGTTGRGGVSFRDSSDCSVTNTKVFDVGVGIVSQDSDKTVIKGNDVSGFTVDGMDLAGSTNILIEDNDVHAATMTVAGTHPDAIQFWETATHPKPGGNVVRGNRIRQEDGTPMQGIFVESQTGIVIEDNAISGGMLNSISLSTCVGGLIDNNFVQGYPTYGGRIITRGGSSDVTVSNNVATGIGSYQDIDQTSTTVPQAKLPLPNYVETNNKIIGNAAAGDLTDYNAWLATQTDHPMPAPPPVTDPPDPTIELKGEIQALQTQLDTAAKQAALYQGQITAGTTQATKYAGGLNTVIKLGTAANAKRQGPTKADMNGVLSAAKTALA